MLVSGETKMRPDVLCRDPENIRTVVSLSQAATYQSEKREEYPAHAKLIAFSADTNNGAFRNGPLRRLEKLKGETLKPPQAQMRRA